jgi:hypothetical protein
MTFLVLDKETDRLIEVLQNLSPEDIEKYELENPDKYIKDEADLLDENFDEDMMDYSDLW